MSSGSLLLPQTGTVLRADDLDGDRAEDLVVALPCSVLVLTGRRDGTFAAPVDYPATTSPDCAFSRPLGMAVGDFDGDRDQDLAVLTTESPHLWLLMNRGDATFGAPATIPAGWWLGPPNALAAAELDGDGRDDLVLTTNWSAGGGNEGLQVLLGGAVGALSRGAAYLGRTNFKSARAVVAGRLDDDDFTDVVAAAQRCQPACVDGVMRFAGHGDGTLGTPDGDSTTGTFVPLGMLPYTLLTAPLRGLERVDVVVTLLRLQALLSAGDGTLTAQPLYTELPGGAGDAADFDRDGALDLLLAPGVAGGSRLLTLLLGDGRGDFAAGFEVDYDPFALPLDVQALDADQDGWPDAVVHGFGRLDLILNTPSAEALDDVVAFGAQRAGTRSTPATVTIYNSGLQPVRLSAASADGPFAITEDGCQGRTLAVVDECSITVAFAPTSAGEATGTLSVPSDDPDGPVRVDLTGTGTAEPAVTPTATPAPVPTVMPDRTPPRLALRHPKQTLANVLRRGVEATVGCGEPCTLSARLTLSRADAKRLRLGTRTVGRASMRIGRADAVRMRIPLTRRARAAVARRRTLTLTLAVVATDTAGNPTERSLRVRVRR